MDLTWPRNIGFDLASFGLQQFFKVFQQRQLCDRRQSPTSATSDYWPRSVCSSALSWIMTSMRGNQGNNCFRAVVKYECWHLCLYRLLFELHWNWKKKKRFVMAKQLWWQIGMNLKKDQENDNKKCSVLTLMKNIITSRNVEICWFRLQEILEVMAA